MADIYSPTQQAPQNTLANKSASVLPSLNNSNTGFRRKSVDLSQFSNLKNNMQSVNNSSQAQSVVNPSLKNLGTITTPYGGSTKIEANHPGVDIANKIGTAIPNMAEGTVVEIQSGYGQNKQFSKDKSAWGNTVVIRDKNGNYWRYSHLLDTYVKAGQKIAKGQQLGQMGNSGNTYSTSGGTGSHLDLRLWKLVNGKKQYINPMTYNS